MTTAAVPIHYLSFLFLSVVFVKSVHNKPQVLYSHTENGVTSFGSSDLDFTKKIHSPGASYITKAEMYTNEEKTGYSVGFQATVCFQLMAFGELYCTTTVTFDDGSGSINAAGYYLAPEGCGYPKINVFGITGGSGTYSGITGAIHILLTRTNLDPNTGIHRESNMTWRFGSTPPLFAADGRDTL